MSKKIVQLKELVRGTEKLVLTGRKTDGFLRMRMSKKLAVSGVAAVMQDF